jgi:hypothetical protein
VPNIVQAQIRLTERRKVSALRVLVGGRWSLWPELKNGLVSTLDRRRV